MSTTQTEIATEDRNGAQQPSSSRPSLAEIARIKSSFTWTRPFPSYVASSSRGSIPHLTPDNILLHTNIDSVHVGLEDFITFPPQNSAIFSIQTPLQRYLAYPDKTSIVYSARRANPVPVNSSWDNKIEIQTVDGRNPLPVEVFLNSVQQLQLRQQDIVISVSDFTESPGVKRLTKMVERAKRWLSVLLESKVCPR